MFWLIVLTLTFIASDMAGDDHVTIIGFITAGLIITASVVYSPMKMFDPAQETAVAVFMLLSIANVT